MSVKSVVAIAGASLWLSFSAPAAEWVYSIQNGGVSISYYAGMSSTVTVPETLEGLPVREIGVWAFQWNTTITNVSLPDSVLNIASGAFYDCSNLQTVNLGKHLENIGPWAFWNCQGLSRVTIPTTVTNLSDFAFGSCSHLRDIYIPGNPPALGGTSVFSAVPDGTVYYLSGTGPWSSYFGFRPTALWNARIVTDAPLLSGEGNGFGFTVQGTPDIPVVVRAAAGAVETTWVEVLRTNLLGGTIQFRDSEWTNHASRFYRLSWQ